MKKILSALALASLASLAAIPATATTAEPVADTTITAEPIAASSDVLVDYPRVELTTITAEPVAVEQPVAPTVEPVTYVFVAEPVAGTVEPVAEPVAVPATVAEPVATDAHAEPVTPIESAEPEQDLSCLPVEDGVGICGHVAPAPDSSECSLYPHGARAGWALTCSPVKLYEQDTNGGEF